MRIVVVPQLMDNYGYLVVDPATGEAAIVDPAEADVVLAAVKREGVKLTAILNTHHHWDHSGGNSELLAAVPGLQVIGSEQDASKIPGLTRAVKHGDRVKIGGLEAEVLLIPCHTSGHVAYRFGSDLFTGDTLFVAGCGRFFEGTAADMYHALYEVIGALPDDTRIWCGHEYTAKNLEFAAKLEPKNQAIAAKRAWVAGLGSKPSVPSTLGEERRYNPFLRVQSSELQRSLAAQGQLDPADPVLVLGAIRALKDRQ